MSAQMLEVSLGGVGTVLRLERDAWSMVKWLRQATNEYALPPLSPPPHTPPQTLAPLFSTTPNPTINLTISRSCNSSLCVLFFPVFFFSLL